MKEIAVNELMRFSTEALKKAGLNEENAQAAAETLVTTDTFGVLSHGTKNLYQYIQKMQVGGLDANAVPTIEKEGPAWAVLNGNDALGMVSANKAMKLAIEKAKKTGIAYVSVKNSCHFGAAGYYANLAAKEGMIGLSMSNADPNMAIPGSSDVAIGNNPFAFSAPTKDGKSVFLDIALSNVAALKVVMAKEKGQTVPETWLVDENGRPTSDPSGFPEKSHLQPMAAHKGYGFAMMVEILTSVIAGGNMLSQVASWNLNLANKNRASHAFIAIDIKQMMDINEFEDRMAQVVSELKNAPKGKDVEQIFVPGEMDWAKRDAALSKGYISLTDAMVENMKKLSELTGVSINW